MRTLIIAAVTATSFLAAASAANAGWWWYCTPYGCYCVADTYGPYCYPTGDMKM